MTPSTIIPEEVFLGGVSVWASLTVMLLIRSGRSGSWKLTTLACLLASPLPMAAIVQFMERRSIPDVLSYYPRLNWAFLLGDSIILPLAASMMALGWRRLEVSGRHDWRTSRGWAAISIGVGLTAALVVRFGSNVPQCRRHDAMNSCFAPSMLFHDFGAFPALFAALFCLGVPLVVREFSPRWPYIRVYWGPYLGRAGLMIMAFVSVWLYHDLHLIPQFIAPDGWVWPGQTQ